ncbi:MAG: HTH domain-containing protein [Bacteroidales bacterium]|nr:HTH domain-containing protein [Bacteroidales bacterium]
MEEETNKKLNLTERCIIAYIKGWERGYYGSQNTLAKRLGISERTANRTISTLLKDGFLFKEGKFLYYNKERKEVNNVEEDDEEWLKLMSAIEE